MQIVRYVAAGGIRIGVRDADGATTATRLPVASIAEWGNLPAQRRRAAIDQAGDEDVEDEITSLLPPIDAATEVWACGVTYRRSRDAREEESDVADVYDRVYDADRPEVFFKSTAWRVSGDGEPIGIRTDSELNVPEPELALVCNARAEVVGYTICDDVTSRSIEGENPLYLPQAKIYAGACALGPAIAPAWLVPDPRQLWIDAAVHRDGQTVWRGETSTSLLHRRVDELVEHVFRHQQHPDGVVISTGTGVVPGLDFTLQPGDTVVVEIEHVGSLHNPVRPSVVEEFGWLAARACGDGGL